MQISRLSYGCCVTLALLMLAALPAYSQTGTNAKTVPADPFHNLEFRNLGPAVAGGRVTSVVGIPGNPRIYYVGAAGGGVWKTTDGGLHWQAIFTKQATASISNIALAPSNPNLVWVATDRK